MTISLGLKGPVVPSVPFSRRIFCSFDSADSMLAGPVLVDGAATAEVCVGAIFGAIEVAGCTSTCASATPAAITTGARASVSRRWRIKHPCKGILQIVESCAERVKTPGSRFAGRLHA